MPVTDCMILADADGRIAWANDAAQALLGIHVGISLSPECVTECGLYYPDTVTPLRFEDLPLQRIIQGESSCESEICVRSERTGNETRWLTVSASAVLAADGSTLASALLSCRDTTERSKALRGLEDSNAVLRALIQASPLAMIAFNADGNVTFWNNAAEALFGWSEAETLGKPLPFIPEEKYAEHRQMRQKDLAGEGFISRELTRRRKDGSAVDLSVSTAAIRNVNGLVTGVMSVYVDVTGRNRMLQALRSSEENYRFLTESLPHSVWTVDENRRIEYCNQHWIEYTGFSMKDSTIADVVPVFHPDDRERYWQARETSWRTGNAFEDEIRIRRSVDGEYRAHLVKVSLLPFAGGLRKWLGIAFDIEDLKRTEKALRASQERFQRLFDSNIIGIALWNSDGVITEANSEFLRTTGRSAADLRPQGLSLPDFVTPECVEAANGILRQIRDQGVSETIELQHLAADGTRMPVLAGGAALNHSEGTCISFALDISERKRLDEKVREAAKLESLGVLAGGIAHDFNNLLTGILGNASLAFDECVPGSFQADALRNAIHAGERASALTRQMLAYSGKGRFTIEYLDLSACTREIVGLINASLSNQAKLEMRLDDELDSVEGDPTQMQQIIMNLVINAGEAVAQDGHVTIETGSVVLDGAPHPDDALVGQPAPAGPCVYLEITDNGHGMDKETLRRIFDPFYTTKFTGRGLGLAAVLGIVRGHKGGIRVSSTKGQGTRFSVFFPSTSQPATYPRERKNAESRRGFGTILAVDDEAVVLSTVRITLEKSGYTVLCASSAAEALELMGAHPVRVALIDVLMPGTHGGELAAIVREKYPSTKLIATSGFSETEMRAYFNGEIDAFLNKPFRASDLREIIQSVD